MPIKPVLTPQVLAASLHGLEHALRVATSLNADPKPGRGATSHRRVAETLDQGILLASEHAASPDREVREAAQLFLRELRFRRLKGEDAIEAWYVDDLIHNPPERRALDSLDASRSQGTPDRGSVSSPESDVAERPFLAALALARDLSEAELEHALKQLRHSMGPESEGYFNNAQIGRERAVRSARFRAGVWNSVVISPGPATLSLVGASGLSAAKVLDASLTSGIGTIGFIYGARLGRHLAAENKANKAHAVGVNRKHGARSDHDLIYLRERIADKRIWERGDRFFKAKPVEALKRQLPLEISLIEEFVARRTATWGRERASTAAEREVVQAFKVFASRLDEASWSSDVSERVEAARKELLASVPVLKLEGIPSLSATRVAAPTPEQLSAALDVLVRAQNDVLLEATNPALLHHVERLRAEYGAEGGKRPLAPGDKDYLKLLVSPTPNLSELLGIAGFIRSGDLRVGELWNVDLGVPLPGAGTLDARGFDSLANSLSTRRSGGRLEKAADALNWLLPLAAVAAGRFVGYEIDALMDWGVLDAVLPTAGVFATSIGTYLGGGRVASWLQRSGIQSKVLAGTQGLLRPVETEYALLIERWRNPPGALSDASASAKDVRAALLQEANLAASAVRSVLAHADALNDALASPDAIDPRARGRATAEAVQFARDAQVMYGEPVGLRAFSLELRELAQSDMAGAELRREFAFRRARFIDAIYPNVIVDHLARNSLRERDERIGGYLDQKLALLDAIVGGRPQLEVMPLALALKSRYDKLTDEQRDSITDALDNFSIRMSESSGAYDAEIARLTEPNFVLSVRKKAADLQTLPNERAIETAQQTLELLWRSVYEIVGSLDPEKRTDPPRLQGAVVERIRDPEHPEHLPTLRVRARLEAGAGVIKGADEIEGGREFTIEMNGLGEPSRDLTKLHLDLGPLLLSQMARTVLATHLRSEFGRPIEIGDTSLVSASSVGIRPEDFGEERLLVFRCEAGGSTYNVAMTPAGFVIPATLEAARKRDS